MNFRAHTLIATTIVAAALATNAAAHCQIPCGIYDDELRVQLIEEHIGTVEKSMTMIGQLSAADPKDFNQITRWVVNKEDHAEKIQELVTSYFMAQRIKHPGTTEGEAWTTYVGQLTLLHQIQVTAMKTKQSIDLQNVATLRKLVGEFRTAYFGPEAGHSH